MPLGLYRQHETAILATEVPSSKDVALSSLRHNPGSRLIITFHGNAGHVAQNWRPDAYRMLTGAGPDSIHVLAFDYRGFGYSTGSPTEQGVISDGIAVVDWALDVIGIAPERIVLFGQSLGTAVATAVAEHFATERKIEFAGLVLIAPFASIPKLLPGYSISGFIPTLAPLKMYPTILRWVQSKIVDTWNTAERLASLVRNSKSINLALIHARNDAEIPSDHSEHLFLVSANATTKAGMDFKTILDMKRRREIAGGGWKDSWTAAVDDGLKTIKLVISPSGGHNQIMTYPTVAKEVLDCFGMPDS